MDAWILAGDTKKISLGSQRKRFMDYLLENSTKLILHFLSMLNYISSYIEKYLSFQWKYTEIFKNKISYL